MLLYLCHGWNCASKFAWMERKQIDRVTKIKLFGLNHLTDQTNQNMVELTRTRTNRPGQIKLSGLDHLTRLDRTNLNTVELTHSNQPKERFDFSWGMFPHQQNSFVDFGIVVYVLLTLDSLQFYYWNYECSLELSRRRVHPNDCINNIYSLLPICHIV